MKRRSLFSVASVLGALALVLGACAPATPITVVVTAPPVVVTSAPIVQTVQVPVEITATPAPAKKLKVFGAYATPLEEPWDNVIHTALQAAMTKGEIDYTWADNIGYSGDMERVLREQASNNKPCKPRSLKLLKCRCWRWPALKVAL